MLKFLLKVNGWIQIRRPSIKIVVRIIEKNYIYVHTFHGNQLPISSHSLLIVFAKWAGPYQEMFTVNDAKRLRVRSIGKSGFRF